MENSTWLTYKEIQGKPLRKMFVFFASFGFLWTLIDLFNYLLQSNTNSVLLIYVPSILLIAITIGLTIKELVPLRTGFILLLVLFWAKVILAYFVVDVYNIAPEKVILRKNLVAVILISVSVLAIGKYFSYFVLATLLVFLIAANQRLHDPFLQKNLLFLILINVSYGVLANHVIAYVNGFMNVLDNWRDLTQDSLSQLRDHNIKVEKDSVKVQAQYQEALLIQQEMLDKHGLLKSRMEEIKNLNRIKDDLFLMFSTDLQRPILLLQGELARLSQSIGKVDNQDVKNQLDNVFLSSEKQYHYILNLVLWASSKLGKHQLHPRRFKIYGLVKEGLNLLKQQVKDKELKVDVKVSGYMKVYADRFMISTVLLNLLSNAIKYSESKGQIVIDAFVGGGYLSLSFIDEGVGILSGDLNNWFLIKEMHALSATVRQKGHGLGLVIADEFAAQNGGSLAVSSKLGFGSKFTLTLPLFK